MVSKVTSLVLSLLAMVVLISSKGVARDLVKTSSISKMIEVLREQNDMSDGKKPSIGDGGGESSDYKPNTFIPGIPIPGIPGVPIIPGIPGIPGIPRIPGIPGIPGIPIPGIPGVPAIPGIPIPGIPGVPIIPGIPGIPGIPETPGIPKVSSGPTISDTSGAPSPNEI